MPEWLLGLLGGAVLAFVAGWLIRRRKAKKWQPPLPAAPEAPDTSDIDKAEDEALKDELARLRQELLDVRTRYDKLQKEHEAAKAAEIARLAANPDELEAALREYQDDQVPAVVDAGPTRVEPLVALPTPTDPAGDS